MLYIFSRLDNLRPLNWKIMIQTNKRAQGFRKIQSCCHKIRIFDGCFVSNISRATAKKRNTQKYGHRRQKKKKQGDPIFLLQFLNIFYMADTRAKFEKNLDSTSFQGKRPFARWSHFTTTTRILFVFPFIFWLGNPSEVSITKALICTRK